MESTTMRTEKQTIITLDRHDDHVVVRLNCGTLRVVGHDGNEVVIRRETGGADGDSEMTAEDVARLNYDRLVIEGGTPNVELWMGTRARSDNVRVYSGRESGAPAGAPDAYVDHDESVNAREYGHAWDTRKMSPVDRKARSLGAELADAQAPTTVRITGVRATDVKRSDPTRATRVTKAPGRE